MSLYQQILNNKPNYDKQFKDVLPCNHCNIIFGNFEKHCSENNHIYRRFKPIDNIEKYNLLNPRSLVKEGTNPLKYNVQCDIFPDKTEDLLKHKKDFNQHHIQQNIGYINDESFLFNINHKTNKHKTFNIYNNIVEMNKESELDNLFEKNKSKSKSLELNTQTSRKMTIKDITQDNQNWCEGSIYNKNYFSEI